MKAHVQFGTTVASEKYQVVVSLGGPLLVYGHPPLAQLFMMPDGDGEIWYYKAGQSYSTEQEPLALCRCGHSTGKPYCDGSHQEADWDPELTASTEALLEGAEEHCGPQVNLTDNPKYCASARFCMAKGSIWKTVKLEGQEAADATVHMANHCPSGRLLAWNGETNLPYEPPFEPTLSLIEDSTTQLSGPLWLRGGILMRREDGFTYEVRNRVTLCRCGQSSNKPYCDGKHVKVQFRDGLLAEPLVDGEEF